MPGPVSLVRGIWRVASLKNERTSFRRKGTCRHEPGISRYRCAAHPKRRRFHHLQISASGTGPPYSSFRPLTSLYGSLKLYRRCGLYGCSSLDRGNDCRLDRFAERFGRLILWLPDERPRQSADSRSEEHTSELQSLMRNTYAVFCLKKQNTHNNTTHIRH